MCGKQATCFPCERGIFCSSKCNLENMRKPRNEYVIEGDTVKIFIKETFAIIDLIDLNLAIEYRWHIAKGGYAMNGLWRERKQFMHHFIIPKTEGMYVDHKNRNKLDNRRENLHLVTSKENVRNRGLNKNNTSGYRGINRINRKGRTRNWEAKIDLNYKSIYLGSFVELEDAIKARRDAELKYWGKHYD
jgi:hypothetical protein